MKSNSLNNLINVYTDQLQGKPLNARYPGSQTVSRVLSRPRSIYIYTKRQYLDTFLPFICFLSALSCHAPLLPSPNMCRRSAQNAVLMPLCIAFCHVTRIYYGMAGGDVPGRARRAVRVEKIRSKDGQIGVLTPI
jgi:hypothetical protein